MINKILKLAQSLYIAMKMEEFAWPIFDHGKIIIGKKTSERRKVQATSFNIFYHHFALIVEVL